MYLRLPIEFEPDISLSCSLVQIDPTIKEMNKNIRNRRKCEVLEVSLCKNSLFKAIYDNIKI